MHQDNILFAAPNNSGQCGDNDTIGQNNEHDESNDTTSQFGPVQEKQKVFPYTGLGGVNDAFIALLQNGPPFGFYSVFIDDKIWSKIVDETNLYAT